MISIQSILNKIASMANRTGLFSIQKSEFFDTLTDITNKVKEVNDNVNSVAKSLIWQNPVATFADLATTYPDAVQGWAAMVTSLGFIHSWNGSEWTDTGLTAFPIDVATKSFSITKSSKFLKSDSISIPDGILDFGTVDYVDDGTELYILTIRANIGLIQVAKADETAIAQYYGAAFLNGVSEVELKEIGGEKVLFKALIDWSLFDSDSYTTWFNSDLHINVDCLYTSEIKSKINVLNENLIGKISPETIYKPKINLFDKDSSLIQMGKWIPSTSTTGLPEDMSGTALLTGFIKVSPGDKVNTTLANEPENYFSGYYAIFDNDKNIITQPDIILPNVIDDGLQYIVKEGEGYVRICFRNVGVDLTTMANLMVTVNQRYTGDFISFGLTNRIDLKKVDVPGSFFGEETMFCGDSVTEFGTYPEQVAELIGAKAIKVGYGGCRMAAHADANYNELSMYRIANAINTGDFLAMETAINNLIVLGDDNSAAFNRLAATDFSKLVVLTVFFGTNDFTGNVPIGTNADADGATFKGAVNYSINKILSAYPNIRLSFITPTHRFISDNAVGDSDTTANGNGNYLIDYVNAIVEVANLNHIPVLDLYRKSGLNKYNHAHYFGIDGVHPNSVGYTYLANKIAAFLKSLFSF